VPACKAGSPWPHPLTTHANLPSDLEEWREWSLGLEPNRGTPRRGGVHGNPWKERAAARTIHARSLLPRRYLPRRERSWVLNPSAAIGWFHNYGGWSIPLARLFRPTARFVRESRPVIPTPPSSPRSASYSCVINHAPDTGGVDECHPVRGLPRKPAVWVAQHHAPEVASCSREVARADSIELTELGLGCHNSGCLGGFRCFL
jgi:hypothetical protein